MCDVISEIIQGLQNNKLFFQQKLGCDLQISYEIIDRLVSVEIMDTLEALRMFSHTDLPIDVAVDLIDWICYYLNSDVEANKKTVCLLILLQNTILVWELLRNG